MLDCTKCKTVEPVPVASGAASLAWREGVTLEPVFDTLRRAECSPAVA